MKRLGSIIAAIFILIIGLICAIGIGDDGGMIFDAIACIKNKDK